MVVDDVAHGLSCMDATTPWDCAGRKCTATDRLPHTCHTCHAQSDLREIQRLFGSLYHRDVGQCSSQYVRNGCNNVLHVDHHQIRTLILTLNVSTITPLPTPFSKHHDHSHGSPALRTRSPCEWKSCHNYRVSMSHRSYI